MKYIKDHKNWNKLKEILDFVDIPIPYYEGEIWRVSFGVNIGIEIDGKGDNFERPAIIIKKFNKNHAWVVPITTRTNLLSGIHIPLFHPALNKDSVAVLSQMQSFSDQRLMEKMGVISFNQLASLRKLLKECI